MLIATFGATTAWQGKRITWDGARFVLDDHGPISPPGIMEYDRQGHLIWADEGTRAWVGSTAMREWDSAPAQESHPRARRVFVGVIVALLVLNLVLLLIASHLTHLL